MDADLELIRDLAAGATRQLSGPKPDLCAVSKAKDVARHIFEAAVDQWSERLLSDLKSMHHDSLETKTTGTALNVKGLEHIRASEMPTPKNYAEAIKGEFAEFWKDSIRAEINNLKEHGTFEWVPPPPQKV